MYTNTHADVGIVCHRWTQSWLKSSPSAFTGSHEFPRGSEEKYTVATVAAAVPAIPRLAKKLQKFAAN